MSLDDDENKAPHKKGGESNGVATRLPNTESRWHRDDQHVKGALHLASTYPDSRS